MSSSLHPDGKLNPSDSVTNPSGNASILDVIEARQMSRRAFLKNSVGATAVAALGGSALAGMSDKALAHPLGRKHAIAAALHSPSPAGGIGFASIAPNVVPMSDKVTVPAGYTARVLVSWGDSLNAEPHWDTVGAMDEATQLRSFGAHNDGMHYFPFTPAGKGKAAEKIGNWRGLLVANNEYCDPGLVCNTTSYGTDVISEEMVRAQLAAHGVSIVEVWRKRGGFEVKRPSAFNRRITGRTPCRVSGPAAGHPMMKTDADGKGKVV
ncbi:MAG: DUF839 domain-containing protein, partial [Burkholderiales bacterium]